YLKPSLPTPGQPTEAETAEIKKITSSIKRLIVSQRITVNGQPASFDKLVTHKRTQSGIEIVFIVVDPLSGSPAGTSSGVDPSGSLITSSFTKKLICRGILSLVPGVKDSVKCEELKDGDEQYLKPSLPTPGQPTEAETVEITKITTSIKRLIVSQGITVNGQPARFDKLVTHKKTQSGIEIEFTVMDPRSDSTGGTSSGADPSGSLTVLGITKKLICKGVLSLVPGVKDSIKCEEVKDNVEEGPTPSLPGLDQTTQEDITEMMKITASIKRLIVAQGITVSGQLARFETLITHK
ncbi:hypothetical protein M514_28447, partial [Trichuris suis]